MLRIQIGSDPHHFAGSGSGKNFFAKFNGAGAGARFFPAPALVPAPANNHGYDRLRLHNAAYIIIPTWLTWIFPHKYGRGGGEVNVKYRPLPMEEASSLSPVPLVGSSEILLSRLQREWLSQNFFFVM